ncbi:MAG: TetR/AcrR family transcriptional regulator [Bacteroidota bacterium]
MQQAAKSISRKKQIELKATELFWQKGYTASSMRDLANLLGIEAASIYSHIKSKEEILQTVCFRMANEFFDAIDEIKKNSYDTEEENLKKSILAHLSVITKDKKASSVFFNEWRHLSEPHLTRFTNMRKTYEQWFNSILERGVKNGEFKLMNTKLSVMSILSALNWSYRWYDPQGKYDTEEVAENFSHILLNGLKS